MEVVTAGAAGMLRASVGGVLKEVAEAAHEIASLGDNVGGIFQASNGGLKVLDPHCSLL